MKKLLLTLVLLAFVFGSPVFAQRNRANFRPDAQPFNWKEIEGKFENKDGKITEYKIYFPEDALMPALEVNAELPKIVRRITEKVFTRPALVPIERKVSWYKKPGKAFKRFFSPDKYWKEFYLQDSSCKLVKRIQTWQPKHLTIILYANMRDWDNQKIIPAFLPPGILGFTEMLADRIAIPYGGNRHNFKAVVGHEINHGLTDLYIKETRALMFKLGEIPITSITMNAMPLWFSEGLAEFGSSDIYLAADSANNDLRRARTEEINVFLSLNGAVPSFSNLSQQGGFTNYTYGYEQLHHMGTNYPIDSLRVVLDKMARGYEFKKAWKESFNESLERTDLNRIRRLNVKYYARTFAPVDILPQKNLEDSVSIGAIGVPGYNGKSNTIAYYRPNKKWGLEVAVKNLEDPKLKETVISHQFARKSLFYRVWNPPAVNDSMVVITVSRGSRDVLEFYRFWTETKTKTKTKKIKPPKEKKCAKLPELPKKENVSAKHDTVKYDTVRTSSFSLTSKKFSEISFPGILWIEDISFADDGSLLFVGMDKFGQKDAYLYRLKDKNLEKLTDDEGEKYNPVVFGGNKIYIRGGDKSDRHELRILRNGKIYGVNFSESELQKGFIDQVVANDSLLAARMLYGNGLSEILIWPKGENQVYRYRYGAAYKDGDRTIYARNPLVVQLVGLNPKNELIAITSAPGVHGNEFIKINLNSISSSGLMVSKIELVEANDNLAHKEKPDTSVVIKKADRKPRYLSVGLNNMPLMTDATGERGLAIGPIGIAYNNWLGLFYEFGFDYYNFSRPRVWTKTGFNTSKKFDWRGPIYSDFRNLSIDRTVGVSYGLIFPLDLENRVGFDVGGGYLERSYFYSDNNEVIQTPYYNITLHFVSDATFFDPFIASRHGHHYLVALNRRMVNLGNESKLLNGYSIVDLRYYLRPSWPDQFPWQNRFYLASRIMAGNSFGRDPYYFFVPELHRRSGNESGLAFYRAEDFGTKVVLVQTEFRMPILRTMLLSYEFWNSEFPVFVFSHTFSLFYTYGSMWNKNEKNDVRKYGYAFKTGLFWFPLYVRWEKYRYEGKWESAWTLEYEF